MTSQPLRVGFLGAGAVTQAIHLPTLARLPELFTVAQIVDVDEALAHTVASRVGAIGSTDAAAMIQDPSIDVVAIGSPHPFHAAQVIAACEAGKKAVLCEKPLCATLEEALLIRDASSRTGVPVLTATMHLFDPSFAAASSAWPSDIVPAYVETHCFLPANDVFVAQATQLVLGAIPRTRSDGLPSRADRMESGILGLASHHLPLLRRFLPAIDSVDAATPLAPYGYDVTLRGGGTVARLLGVMPGSPVPSWTFDVVARNAALSVTFSASYVQAGSSVARLIVDGVTTEWLSPDTGYVAEWRQLARLAAGEDAGAPFMDAAVEDFVFATTILDGFARLEDVA